MGAFYGCSGVDEVYFKGDVPQFESNVFYDVTAWAYYPAGNTTWNSSKLQNYGGTLMWSAYDPESMKDGWRQEGDHWVYYQNFGKLTSQWLKDGAWYYLDAEGVMVTGWQSVGGKWYFFNEHGAMQTGWAKDSGKWYYLGSDGAMRTGWQRIDGKWYYLKNEMKTGWQKIDGKWYYLKNEMKTGWQQISGKWYYLGTNGVMVTGTHTIEGKSYTFNSSGVWIP
jgi:glucan-binding YG repeat protein